MTLLKNVRALILIVLAVVTVVVLAVPLLMSSNGLVIDSISPNAQCTGIAIGSAINQVSGRSIRSASDFSNALLGIKKGDFVSLVANLKPANCVAMADRDLGFTISLSKRISGFEVGSDIGGGTVYIYRPEKQLTAEQLNSITSIIRRRAQLYGFQGVNVSSDIASNSIMITSSDPNTNAVIYPGFFEARLVENIPMENGIGKIPLGSNLYVFSATNKSISVANQSVPIGSKFVLEGIDFYFFNITDSLIVTSVVIFNNSDIVQTYPQSSTLSLNENNQQYMFVLPIAVSIGASNNFLKITAQAPTTLVSGQISIDGDLEYIIDGRVLSRLTVPLDFARQPLANKQISIIGFSTLQSDAASDRIMVLAALDSGVIDTPLLLEGQQELRATRQTLAVAVSAAAILIAFFATVGVSTTRYGNAKGGMLAFLFVVMEVLAVLGLIYAEIFVTGLSVAINFFTVMGFSFAVVLASLQYFIIVEQNRSGRELTIRFGYRKILSAGILVYLASLAVAVIFASYFDATFSIVVFLSVLLDWLLVRSLFHDFVRKIF